MEPKEDTIRELRTLECALCEQIAQLEQTADASSTAGIREYRKTRLRQIEDLRRSLSERLRRFESVPSPHAEAYRIGSALRDARLVAEGTFGG